MRDSEHRHISIRLVSEHCSGCVRCVRICPTEALRVRNGVARIREERCINCGRCLEVCPEEAIVPVGEGLADSGRFACRAAVVPASYPLQFSDPIDYACSKKALHLLGFSTVVEEAMVAPSSARMLRHYLKSNPELRPVISCASPSVTRLIQMRFPSLLPHVARVEPPLAIAARVARERAAAQHGCAPDMVGVHLVASCVSQIAEVYRPDGLYRHLFDAAVPFSLVYRAVRARCEDLGCAGSADIETHPGGLLWALADGEAMMVAGDGMKTLSVSGLRNIIDVLDQLDHHQHDPFDYITLHSGLLGGVGDSLNVKNPFISASRIRELVSCEDACCPRDDALFDRYLRGEFAMPLLEPRPLMQMNGDIKGALERIRRIQQVRNRLPGLDCSACGSPSCFALAEDIVSGEAGIEDCAIHVRNLYGSLPRH